MPTTKRILAEQCMRILSGGYVTKDTEFDIREIMLAVEQARDRLVKQEVMSTSFLTQVLLLILAVFWVIIFLFIIIFLYLKIIIKI